MYVEDIKNYYVVKKNRKFISDTVLLTKEQILHTFHTILLGKIEGKKLKKF